MAEEEQACWEISRDDFNFLHLKIKQLNNMNENIKKIISFLFKQQKFSSVLFGFIFASLFSVILYTATTSGFMRLSLPALLSFLIASDTSSLELPEDANTLSDNADADTRVSGDNKLMKLDIEIRDAGIPIDGVALLDEVTHEIRIDFRPEATESQKSLARQIADNFNWTVTPEEKFNSAKARDKIIQAYSAQRLVAISPYITVINSLITQKDFEKLKLFMDDLFTQGKIEKDDYLVLANILIEQKISIKPNFDTAVLEPVIEPVPDPLAVEEPAPIAEGPLIQEPAIQTEPEPTVVEPEPEPIPVPAPVEVPPIVVEP